MLLKGKRKEGTLKAFEKSFMGEDGKAGES